MPPSRLFSFAHSALQKVTDVPVWLLPSPITKAPPFGYAKTMTSEVADATLPPSSTMVTVTTWWPRPAYVWPPLTEN